MNMTKSNLFSFVQTALFSALITVCAWIAIPLPTNISFTLQTFAILTASAVLGWKRGSLAVLIYLILGIIGIPVFTGFRGGIGVLAGTTGGYLVGFLFTALLTGFLIEKLGTKSYVRILAMIAGVMICYAFGTLWFWLLYLHDTGPIGLGTILSWCVFPYLLPDALKIFAANFVTGRLLQIRKGKT